MATIQEKTGCHDSRRGLGPDALPHLPVTPVCQRAAIIIAM
jgi:hypothetical protein